MTASRAIHPLRVASRRINLASPSRTQTTPQRWVATSRARPYPLSSSTPPPSTTSRTPPPIPPRSSYAKPTATPAAATTAARKPIPAVSGEPLPDAPPAQPSPNAYSNNNNNAGAAAAAAAASNSGPIDWTNSYHGLGTIAFSAETSAILQARLDPDDIEVKPDGIIYLPEIKYRRILNTAFGPGGWGLAPRGDLIVQDRLVTREYALVANGR